MERGILPELFLAFVPEHIKKIAYSASFGKSKLDTWEKEETCKLLARYQAVSVRESTGVDICSELGCDATHVLDPTLQLDRTFGVPTLDAVLWNMGMYLFTN